MILPLWVSVDLGVMKRYSTLPRSPILESLYHMQFKVISRTSHFWRGLIPVQIIQSENSKPHHRAEIMKKWKKISKILFQLTHNLLDLSRSILSETRSNGNEEVLLTRHHIRCHSQGAHFWWWGLISQQGIQLTYADLCQQGHLPN